ncbi:MAG: septal ring lytic transglycosylase RlpA family protein [candidate division WOR-3 bacterium]|nr:MAG: septal ring lytic transglycosylase RlpA family protein [candidate division WOR-3 bacterium]
MAILLCLQSCCCLLGTPARNVEHGLASYYGAEFHGRKTASGETFDQHDLTCAHRHLPFGTRVKVTNLKNSKSVVVRVNDRGPWVRGRVIDLSYAAAKKIGMVSDGVVKVKVEVVR